MREVSQLLAPLDFELLEFIKILLILPLILLLSAATTTTTTTTNNNNNNNNYDMLMLTENYWGFIRIRPRQR